MLLSAIFVQAQLESALRAAVGIRRYVTLSIWTHRAAPLFACHIVWAEESPCPDGDSYPSDDQIDTEVMTTGRAFGALCRPPLELDARRSARFCDHCSDGDDCGATDLCWYGADESADPGDEQGTCVEQCAEDTDCPLGFSCEEAAGQGTHERLPWRRRSALSLPSQ